MDEPRLVRASILDFGSSSYDPLKFERLKPMLRGMWIIVKSKDRQFCYSPLGEELPIEALVRLESSVPPVYEVHG